MGGGDRGVSELGVGILALRGREVEVGAESGGEFLGFGGWGRTGVTEREREGRM